MHLFCAIESVSENFQEWLKDVGLNKVFVFYLVCMFVSHVFVTVNVTFCRIADPVPCFYSLLHARNVK